MLKKTGLVFLPISILVFALDLITKYIIVSHFHLFESVKILPIFNFTYVRNYGAAFSFLAEHSGWQKYLFVVLALAISLGLLYILWKNNRAKKLQNTAYALIIGGALANCCDRLYNGFVIDFLDFHWKAWHYPVFNVADMAICVGAGLLIFDGMKENKQLKTKESNNKE